MQAKHSGVSLPRAVVALLLLLGCVFLIFGNSLLGPYESGLRSQAVADFIADFLGRRLGPNHAVVRFAVRNVRKIAHAVEFSLLGVVAALMLVILRRTTGHMVLHAVLLVLGVAVADESIQIFTGRGAQVQDILLDFFAGIAGLTLLLLLCWLLSRLGAALRRGR